jgi:hypothetical protein
MTELAQMSIDDVDLAVEALDAYHAAAPPPPKLPKVAR